ncbi:MAG: hypothetical protein MK171_12805 [Pirellulales bacterium]|nr:hypothetical protein [Pirellulales bacterium]
MSSIKNVIEVTVSAVALLAVNLPTPLVAQLVPPPVTDDAPAAGKRVRVTNPEYAGSNVYHTLYLPTDWTPDGKYPVIVEYAPNPWGPANSTGSVDEPHLGFYQSAGEGFIWAVMPFIDTLADPDENANGWWGTHPAGVDGEDVAADYTKIGLIDILENYGGDGASVFVTGFSRGAIAAGQVALRDQLADAWLGFLPHSHYYNISTRNAPNRYPLADSIAGRASFVSAGDRALDGGFFSSEDGYETLRDHLGFPVEFRELPGVGHDQFWIQDDASATSLAIRQEMRDWLADTIANRPGTSSVAGNVTDPTGNSLAGARIQSGDTHWTYTNASGFYELPSLVDSERLLSVSHPDYLFLEPSQTITIAGADLANQNFAASAMVPEPSSCLLVATAVLLLASSRQRHHSI